MVMYFQRAREARPSGPYGKALQGGFVTESVFFESPNAQELKASSDLRIGRLIEDLGVNDIQFSGGLVYYLNSPDGLTTHFTPKQIKINFADTPLENLSDKPPFMIDFPPNNLAMLKQALPEPIYHISHEVEGFRANSPWRTGFPYVTIDVLTGETVSRPYDSSNMTHSRKDVKAMRTDRDSKLVTKQVSGLPYINARYEVTVVEPVKTTVRVHSGVDGSWVEMTEDYVNNTNVAKALDVVVEILFQRDIAPPKQHDGVSLRAAFHN